MSFFLMRGAAWSLEIHHEIAHPPVCLSLWSPPNDDREQELASIIFREDVEQTNNKSVKCCLEFMILLQHQVTIIQMPAAQI